MSDNPVGKDGAARVLARMKKEYKVWRRANVENIERFKKKWYDGHSFVNMWVEGNRIPNTAYFTGHVLAFSLVANLLLLGIVIGVTVGG